MIAFCFFKCLRAEQSDVPLHMGVPDKFTQYENPPQELSSSKRIQPSHLHLFLSVCKLIILHMFLEAEGIPEVLKCSPTQRLCPMYLFNYSRLFREGDTEWADMGGGLERE